MLMFRPHNRFEELERLWLVGGGTHPGAFLPAIFESARITANAISEKYGLAAPALAEGETVEVPLRGSPAPAHA